MITNTLILEAAHLLRILSIISASLSAVGLFAANRRPGRLGLRRRSILGVAARLGPAVSRPRIANLERPPGGRRQRAPEPREDAHSPVGAADSRAIVKTTIPATAPRAVTRADELAALHGLGGLAARARASRYQRTAQHVAALHIDSLLNGQHHPGGSGERHVKFGLELGGQVVTATLLTTSGVFVVVVHDFDPNDAGTILALGPRVAKHGPAVTDLAHLSGTDPDILVYSPYTEAPAQSAYLERPVLTVGGPDALDALLLQRRGLGPTRDALAQLLDADASHEFAARVLASSQQGRARRTAVDEIEALAGRERIVELDLEAGGRVIAITLITTSGIFVVVVRDRSTTDVASFVALGHLVAEHSPAVSELARLTDLRPEIVVYSPEASEPARTECISRRVLTVGGPAAFEALLDERLGQGLSQEALACLLEASKPHGRMSSADIPLLGVGADMPDLRNLG
jgi:hypothetical protein